ncbi:MAG: hypothetical protein ACFBSE_19610 [Prochloraceae cyanobacterium]
MDGIELEIKRLNLTEERAKKSFNEKFTKTKNLRSLNKEQLLEFWGYLR